jgi:hypothetical protein
MSSTQGEPQGASPTQQGTTSDIGPAAPDYLAKAYRNGQDARAAGHARKAIPGEYRDADHRREALCWQAGFDGASMPTFSG